MDQRLEEAGRVGNIDTLYSLIKENANILEEVDKVPFINTPLHIAAVSGHAHFSMEIMRLKPSYSSKLNQEGYSPIHLALHNSQTELVSRLVDMDSHLVRVQGREGKTALHVVAEYGMVDLLAKFLAVCPKSIQDLTIHKETALHIAVKNNNLDAVAVLLGWLEHVDKDAVLKWTDHQGNTVLHISVYNNHIEHMTSLLIDRVKTNARNLEGLTALDIIENPRQSNYVKLKLMLLRAGAMKGSSLRPVSTLAESMKTKMSWHERLVVSHYRGKIYMSNDDRKAVLVVAVLIATSNYQNVLTSLSDSDITPLVGTVFSIINNIGFLASMFEIYLLLPHGYGALQLVLPLVIFNLLFVANLTVEMVIIFLILLSVFYCFKWPVVLHKINPIFVYKKSMQIKQSIFKHSFSFHREIDHQTYA